MKIQSVSDLHLGAADFELPRCDADLVILAGDIGRPHRAVQWATTLGKPVLYVAGNHEFYGSSIDSTIAELRRLSLGTNVRFLEKDQAVVQGVRFLGTTLWTDFGIFEDEETRGASQNAATALLRDFSQIWTHDTRNQLFTPNYSARLFAENSSWLEARLREPFDGPTVVITHHAPSPRSIHPTFAGSLLNGCFVSDAEHLMDGERVTLWIHGHTHNSFDYHCNGTRVVCNPRGYVFQGKEENPLFDPAMVLEVTPATLSQPD